MTAAILRPDLARRAVGILCDHLAGGAKSQYVDCQNLVASTPSANAYIVLVGNIVSSILTVFRPTPRRGNRRSARTFYGDSRRREGHSGILQIREACIFAEQHPRDLLPSLIRERVSSLISLHHASEGINPPVTAESLYVVER